ncbi:MAG: hypothetical protein R2780_01785 [Crocinitomicaceae bacterium]
MKEEAVKAPKRSDNATVVVQTEKQGWWQSLSPEQRKIITNVAIALGISLVAAAAIWFGIRMVRNQIANSEENKSFGKDKHATWAKQIKNAFDNNGWWGTDEELLRRTLREIPSKEDFKKVQASYRKLYTGANLVEDMTGELKQTEYNEMLAIINAKPEKAKDAKNGVVIYDPYGWAKRINAAVNYQWLGLFWGTDEDAIMAVAQEMPTQQAYFDTAQAYFSTYGVGLMTDLKGDLDSATLNQLRKVIVSKPAK